MGFFLREDMLYRDFFQGELVVKEGNMSFDGSGFNINIFTDFRK